MNTEFKVGDKVTYKPYEVAHKATIKEVFDHCPYGFNQDNRVFYRLTGRSYIVNGRAKHDSVVCTTTGLSIVESVFFKSHDKNETSIAAQMVANLIERTGVTI